MQPLEEIPSTLLPSAQAAVAWINEIRGTQFRLTGVVDTDSALSAKPGDPLEFGLVLCEGELCLREQVRVVQRGDAFDVAAVDTAKENAIPALLDPPVGVRNTWIDDQLEKFNFILLLFYRGRW